MRIATFTALSFLLLLSAASAQTVSPLPPPHDTRADTTAVHAPANVNTDYRLVVGDKLRVDVYKDPQLSQSLQVRPDGKITLPLVGDIVAAGRTSNELRDAISSDLKDYITNPLVTVIVVETVPPTVYVMGEVNTPGPQPLHGPTSVLQALAMAGGFKDFAHTKDIKILRKSSMGLRTFRFNYNDAIKSTKAPMLLESGDTIIVP
jgi:polysaccharide export outer membrane protein